MGPGFESQRDHKALTKVGAFFMQASERRTERASKAKRNAGVQATQARLMLPERTAVQRAKRVLLKRALPRTVLQ